MGKNSWNFKSKESFFKGPWLIWINIKRKRKKKKERPIFWDRILIYSIRSLMMVLYDLTKTKIYFWYKCKSNSDLIETPKKKKKEKKKHLFEITKWSQTFKRCSRLFKILAAPISIATCASCPQACILPATLLLCSHSTASCNK